MRLTLAAFFIVILAFIPVAAQTGIPRGDVEAQAVLKAAESFVEAFNNLDWERFRITFADDATVFFPSEVPVRANGRTEIEAGFKPMFGEDKKRGGGPPYLHIEPKDMKVQVAGDVAVMTFHLPRKGYVARRTIVWQKRGGRWLIVHLHASGVELPKADGGL